MADDALSVEKSPDVGQTNKVIRRRSLRATDFGVINTNHHLFLCGGGGGVG